jgi:hypothetical protein
MDHLSNNEPNLMASRGVIPASLPLQQPLVRRPRPLQVTAAESPWTGIQVSEAPSAIAVNSEIAGPSSVHDAAQESQCRFNRSATEEALVRDAGSQEGSEPCNSRVFFRSLSFCLFLFFFFLQIPCLKPLCCRQRRKLSLFKITLISWISSRMTQGPILTR